jgi:hypothetical protein
MSLTVYNQAPFLIHVTTYNMFNEQIDSFNLPIRSHRESYGYNFGSFDVRAEGGGFDKRAGWPYPVLSGDMSATFQLDGPRNWKWEFHF